MNSKKTLIKLDKYKNIRSIVHGIHIALIQNDLDIGLQSNTEV